MAPKVYLGDTSSELQDLRPILIDQIRQVGMIPLEASDTDRHSPDMLEIVRSKIQEADYFIAVITYKRAWEPDDMGGRSLIEVEINLAWEYGKPAALLLPKPATEMATSLRKHAVMQEDSDRKAQLGFQEQLKNSGNATYFEDEADLSKQVTLLLKRWGGEALSRKADTQISRRIQVGEMSTNDIEMLAEKVAEKTAARLQEMQVDAQEEIAQQAVKYNEALRLQPGELVFGRPPATRQFQSDVFIIMPFASEFDGVYRDVIQSLGLEMSLTVLRGDEFSSTRGSIMIEVWAALNACRFVVADITGGNDNVFYELGIAHTLNKPAVVLTQAITSDAVPFDIRHLRYIRYDNTQPGLKRLRDDLKTAIGRLLADLEEGWEA